MESKYLEILELPAVLRRLAEYTSFSAGKELTLALAPSPDPNEVRYRQAETTEAQRLLDHKPDTTLGGVHDLRPLIQNAVRGARLLPQDLLDVRDTLNRARLLRRSISRGQDEFPLLANIAYQLEPCPHIIDEIERCISEHGEVLDGASSALSSIRSQLQVAYDRLMDRLNRIVTSPKHAPHLQEGYVTQRDGRYVIPVKAAARGRIPGLVHDQSASGATLFIEPLATVDLNNRWRELQLEEQREVDRILLALSGLVAEQADAIKSTVEALARLDLALAKAKYANGIHACEPQIVPYAPRRGKGEAPAAKTAHPGSTIDLRQARHPLLDPRTVVPIDVQLGDDYFVIVITGPNTGGKTVSLKTVGLLALMAQCGLHLPVEEGSQLTPFEHICADIGDEQSIEQSLSTFSSHMTNIVRILELVNERSLVLLDELGAGTDPVEGTALAQSLLMHLLQRRVTVLATTHYPELKMFAHNTPGTINACVEFDAETLAPTYELTIGLPGHSNAFSIAGRLGLPTPIVRRARKMVSSANLDIDRFLAEIKETRSQTALVHTQAKASRAEAEALAEELQEKLAHIEEERRAILNRAREQAAEELTALRKELRTLKRKMTLFGAAPAEASDLEAELESLAGQVAPVAPAVPVPVAGVDGQIEVGDIVWVADLNATGQLLALDGQAAEVQAGSFRVRTRLDSLQLREKGAAQPAEPADTGVTVPPAPAISIELHVRGLRVEEALPRIEKYLDDAYRAQAPFVRIVHGKGTGALRKAVHGFLQGHPLIASFRQGEAGEGDTGVTIVKFRQR
jgi:DNA mismatch repair protein MutS2